MIRTSINKQGKHLYRGTECTADHYLVGAKLQTEETFYTKLNKRSEINRDALKREETKFLKNQKSVKP